MRTKTETIGDKTVIRYELSFPDDFQPEQEPAELLYSDNRKIFITPENITNNLLLLRTAQIENDQIEYGFARVRSSDKKYVLAGNLAPLRGTHEGIAYDVYHKDFYESGVIPVQWHPIEIVDFFHTHTLVKDMDPAISNLFSPYDIRDMNQKFATRYWLLGPGGEASCLIDPEFRIHEDEVFGPAYEYHSKLKVGSTYPEALRALLDCVNACGLLLYNSSNLATFYRQN